MLDPVYSGPPSTCSAVYQAWKIVEEISREYADAWFYMACPAKELESEDQLAWMAGQPFRERVRLFPTPAKSFDRVTELFRVPDAVWELVFRVHPEMWDVDMIISARIPMLNTMRWNTGRPSSFRKGSYTGVIGLDDVPLVSCRNSVTWGDQADQHTLAQYMGADGLVLQDLWTKGEVLRMAREWLPPSKVIALKDQLTESVSAPLEPFDLGKSWEPGQEFNVGFVGRATSTRNFPTVVELFQKHFAYAVGKDHVRFFVSTQTTNIKVPKGELEFLSLQHNGRKEFHELLKSKIHVVVNLSSAEDFSLSAYEPLTFGIPLIVIDRPWSGFLGPDYPFKVHSLVEAYALLDVLIKDYAAQYERFRQWHDGYWLKFIQSDRNVTTAQAVLGLLKDFDDARMEKVHGGYGGRFQEVADELTEGLPERVEIEPWLKKEMPRYRDLGVPIALRPNVPILKLVMRSRGYSDLMQAGVMVRDDCLPC